MHMSSCKYKYRACIGTITMTDHCSPCSGVEDIVRHRPDVKDICRPTDNLTALHLASVNSRFYVVRHLALSVSMCTLYPIYSTVGKFYYVCYLNRVSQS